MELYPQSLFCIEVKVWGNLVLSFFGRNGKKLQLKQAKIMSPSQGEYGNYAIFFQQNQDVL